MALISLRAVTEPGSARGAELSASFGAGERFASIGPEETLGFGDSFATGVTTGGGSGATLLMVSGLGEAGTEGNGGKPATGKSGVGKSGPTTEGVGLFSAFAGVTGWSTCATGSAPPLDETALRPVLGAGTLGSTVMWGNESPVIAGGNGGGSGFGRAIASALRVAMSSLFQAVRVDAVEVTALESPAGLSTSSGPFLTDEHPPRAVTRISAAVARRIALSPDSVCCPRAVLYNGFTGCPFSSLRVGGNGLAGSDGLFGGTAGAAAPGNPGAGIASTTLGGGTWQ
jgi:hypothetical protein